MIQYNEFSMRATGAIADHVYERDGEDELLVIVNRLLEICDIEHVVSFLLELKSKRVASLLLNFFNKEQLMHALFSTNDPSLISFHREVLEKFGKEYMGYNDAAVSIIDYLRQLETLTQEQYDRTVRNYVDTELSRMDSDLPFSPKKEIFIRLFREAQSKEEIVAINKALYQIEDFEDLAPLGFDRKYKMFRKMTVHFTDCIGNTEVFDIIKQSGKQRTLDYMVYAELLAFNEFINHYNVSVEDFLEMLIERLNMNNFKETFFKFYDELNELLCYEEDIEPSIPVYMIEKSEENRAEVSQIYIEKQYEAKLEKFLDELNVEYHNIRDYDDFFWELIDIFNETDGLIMLYVLDYFVNQLVEREIESLKQEYDVEEGEDL